MWINGYSIDTMLTYDYIFDILRGSYRLIYDHIRYYQELEKYVNDNNIEDKKPLLKRLQYFYMRANQILNFKQTRFNYYDPKFYQKKYRHFNYFNI